MSDQVRVSVVEFGDRPKYMLQWVDPATGKKKSKTSKVDRDGTKRSRGEAEKEAGALQAKIRDGAFQNTRTGWADFRQRYENEVLSALADGTADNAAGTFNLLESVAAPKRLLDVTPARLSGFQAKLRELGRSEDTIKRHLAYLLAALRWAKRQKLISEVPEVDMPKRVKGSKSMKGRPITGEEFDRMLVGVSKVRKMRSGRLPNGRRNMKAERRRKADRERWRRFLTGLWLSGLRLTEALNLRWDRKPGRLCVSLDGRRPMLLIPGDCQKSGKDQLHPVAPEFGEWLAAVPVDQRRGLVFDLLGMGRPMSDKRAGRVTSAIGKTAGVVVDRRNKRVDGKMVEVVKYASAHDLRRAFGERWSSRIMPKTLQELMRHEAIETTMRFYVGRNAEKTADLLWEAHERAESNKTGNNAGRPAKNDHAAIDANSFTE